MNLLHDETTFQALLKSGWRENGGPEGSLTKPHRDGTYSVLLHIAGDDYQLTNCEDDLIYDGRWLRIDNADPVELLAETGRWLDVFDVEDYPNVVDADEHPPAAQVDLPPNA